MQIPRKIQAGDNVKQSTYNTINGIIDYLHTQKIVGDNQSIKVSQQTNGVAISAIKNPHGVSFSQYTRHPFKMSITDNILTIIQGFLYTPVATVDFTGKEASLPTTAGVYNVYGFLRGGYNFQGGFFYAPENVTVNSYFGFFTFKIGKISVTVDETTSTVSGSVVQQTTLSDISIGENTITHFLGIFNCNQISNGTVLTENLTTTTIIVNGGYLYINEKMILVNALSLENTLGSSGDGTGNGLLGIYLQITLSEDAITAILVSSSENIPYYQVADDEKTIYSLEICTFSSTTTEQYIQNDIVFDDYINIVVDDSVKALITVEKGNNGLYTIKSAIDASTSGLMVVNNGVISFIPVTSQGVIVAKNGTLTVQAIGEC